jgi:hypothetical protein
VETRLLTLLLQPVVVAVGDVRPLLTPEYLAVLVVVLEALMVLLVLADLVTPHQLHLAKVIMAVVSRQQTWVAVAVAALVQ